MIADSSSFTGTPFISVSSGIRTSLVWKGFPVTGSISTDLDLQPVYGTAISIINWPVDEDYEIIRNPSKDARMIEYLNCYFSHC